MFKVFKRLGSSWWLVILLIVSSAGQVLCDCALPTFIGQAISMIQTADASVGVNLYDIGIIAIEMFLVAIGVVLCSFANCYLASKISSKIVANNRYALYQKVSTFSSAEINKFSVSSLVTRTTNDLTLIGNTFVLFFRFAFYGPGIAIVALCLLISTGIWQLTLTVLGAILLLIILIVVTALFVLPKYNVIQRFLDKITLVTRENLEGLRVVRAYNAEDYQENKFGDVNKSLNKIEKFSSRSLGALIPIIMLIIGVLNVLIYYITSKLLPEGQIASFGLITVVIEYASLILVGFVMISIVIVQLPRSVVCAKRVNEVLATDLSVTDGCGEVKEDSVGTVEFRNVTFSYPGADSPVLSNVSFKIEKGKTLAFIGATGSGKSTILNLILRFFDPTSGEVLVDGVNVKEYKLNDLFAKFGYVPQKGYLFHKTLAENITIGKPKATPVEIERALKISQSTEFVSKLPGGLNYEISQGGKNVSGGQRQRLCIARAIIMNPEIFLFDDSFSALDYRTDQILRGEIKKECSGVTNLIVAQRIGTIMDADQIVCLDAGKVMGIGTHKELLNNCSVYKEIALSQLSKEELENGTK